MNEAVSHAATMALQNRHVAEIKAIFISIDRNQHSYSWTMMEYHSCILVHVSSIVITHLSSPSYFR